MAVPHYVEWPGRDLITGFVAILDGTAEAFQSWASLHQGKFLSSMLLNVPWRTFKIGHFEKIGFTSRAAYYFGISWGVIGLGVCFCGVFGVVFRCFHASALAQPPPASICPPRSNCT
jgi:hypothetical protein